MSKVTIHLSPLPMLATMFFNKESVPLIKESLPRYTAAGTFETALQGEEAAEEAFDLTNNPSRQHERENKYGRGRSVSSGDVIEVDGVKWACLSFGWAQL